jgi:Asp-tRNA(Asn)/Glu-tRNA(Gln) amidotransferase B subunit
MVTKVLKEFLDAGVITPQHYDTLNDIMPMHLMSLIDNGNYVEVFTEITLKMLQLGQYICAESTPLRQALRDLFNENPKEWELLKSGNPKMNGFFMGRVFKKVGQIYNPKDVQDKMSEMVAEENVIHFWEE